MLTRTKLLLAGLTAAAMMLSLVATASARNVSVSQRGYELDYGFRFEAGGNNIRCEPSIFLGIYKESTFAKAQHQQVDEIRHSSSRSQTCTGGGLTVLTETLPWQVDYEGFSGRLPQITAIRTSIIGLAFRISTSGLGCLVATTATKPAFAEFLIGAGGTIEGYRFDERVGIPLGGGFLCSAAGEGHLSGVPPVRNLPRTNNLIMTLI